MFIAASGAQKTLLEEEFPFLPFVDLPGYAVKYDKNRALTILRLIRSIPKILIRIKQEKAWLKQFATRERLDLVISDNRYGLYVPGIFCVFVTHQLAIKTPLGPGVDALVQSLNHRAIGRFSRCWVADRVQSDNLAGTLSHPRRMPAIPTHYIGTLSRFAAAAADANQSSADSGKTADTGGYLLALLSGPEPQRTLFEKTILGQARTISPGVRLVLVRGLPGGGEPLWDVPHWLTIHDHLTAAALEPVVRDAALVIARAGYSTIMDLERLGKRALLVPTPGQTEQEYLGMYLDAKRSAFVVDQSKFSLSAAFELSGKEGHMAWGGPDRSRPAEDASLLKDEIRAVLKWAQS